MDQHFDAERLAAFADGSLSRDERAAFETHAADCPRCLQLLSAMVRTEDAAPIAARGPWRIPVVLRWSVPLLAGVTALAIWMNVDQPRERQAPPAAVVSPDAALPPANASGGQPQIQEDATARKAQTGERREAIGRSGTKTSDDSRTDARTRAKAEPSIAEAVPPAAPLSDSDLRYLPKQTLPQPAPASPALPNAGPVAAPAAGVAGNAPGETSARLQAPEARLETLSTQRRGQQAIQVISPGAAVQWRVAGRAIVRSSDGGKTWAAERVPVQGEILAGSSPSAMVAWFVGRGGYILVTNGTNQWRRVIFPDSPDLSTVTARSEAEAEVTTSDGRVFATNDGGRTWARR